MASKRVVKRQEFFKEEFDKLAIDGFIGDPNGIMAYGYIRVSSDEQADEGRSGLPRQIEHIHDKARECGVKIPWELLFADDYSGFELSRPELDRLRKEYKQKSRRANAIVMERLSRLSRNAKWHQGCLLDEMEMCGIQTVFWKPLGSPLEQTVQGVIAQEGMEEAKELMREGLHRKQDDGRITAKRPALGYKFVDDNGQEGTARVSRFTHYAIDEDRALVIRLIFDELAYRGTSVFKLQKLLDACAAIDERYKPQKSAVWNERSISRIVKNELYKGAFISNRSYKEKVVTYGDNGDIIVVEKDRQRPPEEWKRTTVDALVDAETWELANKNLCKNKQTAKRNAKYEYLLSSLLRCDTCKLTYMGKTVTYRGGDKHKRYYCSRINETPARQAVCPCRQPSIKAETLENAVWSAIMSWLLNPEVVEAAIEAKYNGQNVQGVWDEIAYLERQIDGKKTEEEKLRRAYYADAFTAEEFAEERRRIIRERDHLLEESKRLKTQIMTPQELAAKKQAALTMIQEVNKADLANAPFSLKRRIIKLMVDRINLNIREQWFKVDGVVSGAFFTLSTIDSTFSPKSSGNGNLNFSLTYNLKTETVINADVQFASA